MSEKYPERASIALLLAAAALCGLAPMGDWDVWWHLKTGELALRTFSFLPADPFSLTMEGAPWRYKDLGAEVLLYALWAAGGTAGLALFKLAASICVMSLLVLLVGADAPLSTLKVAAAGTAFLVASFRIVERPATFSLAAFALFLWWIDRWRRGRPVRGSPPLHAALLVALQLVWANLHREALLGPVLLWALLACEAARRAPRLRLVALTAAAATAACLCNPSGAAIFTQTFKVLTSAPLAGMVSEWERLSIAGLWRHFPLALAWMGLVAAALAALLARRLAAKARGRPAGGWPDAWDLFLLVVFTAWGLKAPRMLPYVAIATARPLAELLPRLAAPLAAGAGGGGRIGRLASLLAGCAVLAGAAWTTGFELPRPGWEKDRYPEAAVRLVRDLPVEGQGYTSYIYAGYLLHAAWPGKRVMCDGRFDTVYPDEVVAECVRGMHDRSVFERLARRRGLQWVLASNRPARPGEEGSGGDFAFLDGDPAWALVHWDKPSLLYVRRDGPNGKLAEGREYRMLRPHDLVLSLRAAIVEGGKDPAVMKLLDQEVRRLAAAAPGDHRAWAALALFLRFGGAGRPAGELAAVLDVLRGFRGDDPEGVDTVLRIVGSKGE